MKIIKNPSVVVGKFVILMRIRGENFEQVNKKSYFSKKITLLFYNLPVRFSKVNVIGRLEEELSLLNVTFHSLEWALISKSRRFIALRLSISKNSIHVINPIT